MSSSPETSKDVQPVIQELLRTPFFDHLSRVFRASDLLRDELARVELAEETGESPERLISKALTLYEAALDAHDEGKTIAILDENLEIEHEITGFEPAVSASPSLSPTQTQ